MNFSTLDIHPVIPGSNPKTMNIPARAAGKYLDLVFNFEQKQSSRLFADWVNVCIQDKKVTKYLVAAYVNSKYIHY